MRRFTFANGGTTLTQADLFFDGQFGRLRAAVLGPDGALYMTTSNGTNDRILRVVPGDVVVDRIRRAGPIRHRGGNLGGDLPARRAGRLRRDRQELPGRARRWTRGRRAIAGLSSSSPAAGSRPSRPPSSSASGRSASWSSAAPAPSPRRCRTSSPPSPPAARPASPAPIASPLRRRSRRATFAAGVPVAYVATGLAFPDALSGGPAAGRGGWTDPARQPDLRSPRRPRPSSSAWTRSGSWSWVERGP